MQLQGIIGVVLFALLAFLFSKRKKSIDWKIVIWGVVMQFVIAGIILGNNIISLSCFFLYIWAIVTYNLKAMNILKMKSKILQMLVGAVVTTTLSFLFSLTGTASNIIQNTIWALFVIVGSLRCIFEVYNKRFLSLSKYWTNVMGVLIAISIFGSLLATGTTGSDFFRGVGDTITAILNYSDEGGRFLFGGFYNSSFGFVFAMNTLVSMVFFTALVSLLDSLGIMNHIISSIARFINWNMLSLGIVPLSGVETLVSIGAIPLGGTNLLFAKNYLDKLTDSEILLSLAGVMATITAALFAAFVSIGISATHLLAASAMSVPAVIALSKILIPETEKPLTRGAEIEVIKNENTGKPLAALMSGTSEGMQISLFMFAALIVFISLIALVNGMLGNLDAYVDGHLLGSIFGGEKNLFGEFKGIIPGSVKTIFGYIFSPLAFAMGVPIDDMFNVGYLMGSKISINEFVAFVQLGEFIKNSEISQTAILVASFALCGFANPGTIAIVLGTVSPYVKEKKENFARLGFISIFIGASASWMTASIASLFGSLI